MAKRSRHDVKHAVDLLWIHQIRRENAFLHKQIQQIQDSLFQDINKQEELRRIAQGAQRSAAEASAAIKPVTSDLVALRASFEQTASTANATFEQFGDLTQRVEVCEQTWQKNTNDINDRIKGNEIALRELHGKYDEHAYSSKARYDELSRTLQSKLGENSLESLHLRIDALERQLIEPVACQDSLSRVEDSIELPHSQKKRTLAGCNHEPHRSPRSTDEEVAGGEEQMLTLRNVERRESTADESFDLDGNIAVPSYVLHAYQAPPPLIDSLQPIAAEDTHIDPTRAEISGLKQGRYHSWDRYLAEGQSIMDKIPREQEMSLVKHFVDGLYAVGEREQCRQWLNLSGWCWDNVAGFPLSGTPSAAARMSAPKINKRGVPVQNREARSQAPPLHERQRVSTNKALRSNSRSPRQKGSAMSEAPRRSTRIAESQSRYRVSKVLLDENQRLGQVRPERPGRYETSDSDGAPPVGRDTLPTSQILAASSMRQTQSRPGHAEEALHNQQDCPASPQSCVQTPTRESLRSALPSTPKRGLGSLSITGRGSVQQTRSQKRTGPSERFRTDSMGDDATASDGVQLPTVPSPEPERRKKRRIKLASKRRTMLPPPDIPILPTSE